jgi:hypothetical protein
MYVQNVSSFTCHLSTVFMAIEERKNVCHSLFVNSGVQWMSGPKTK